MTVEPLSRAPQPARCSNLNKQRGVELCSTWKKGSATLTVDLALRLRGKWKATASDENSREHH